MSHASHDDNWSGPEPAMPRGAVAMNAFTVDVEEYFQVSAFESVFPRESWDTVPKRVEDALDTVLDIAAKSGVRGTFYFLGWTAERSPGLLRKVQGAGHEIGCHSYEHRLVYEMSPDGFRADLRRALAAISDATGVRCRLYRAPSFSIVSRSLWALPALAEEGVEIDSSIFPIRHDRYGIEGAPRHPFRPLREAPRLVEVPPSTVSIGGLVLPCAGGGYLRLYPLSWTNAAIRRLNVRERSPAVVYVHPWEFDPEQPRVKAGLVTNFRHRVGLSQMAGRLERLLRAFPFARMTDLVESVGGPESLPHVDLRGVSA